MRFFLYVLRVSLFVYAFSEPLFHYDGWEAPKAFGVKVLPGISPKDYTIKQFGPACLIERIGSVFGAENLSAFVSSCSAYFLTDYNSLTVTF